MTNWIVGPTARKGYSLIELITVLLFIGIVASVVVPRWGGRGVNLYAQAQMLMNDIRYTQNLAMTQGRRYRINFLQPNSYTITTTTGTLVTNPSTNTTTVTFGTGISYGTITNLPSSLLAFDGKGQPYVDSGATTSLTSTATIILSTANSSRTISVNPSTGSVSVQ